MVLNWWYNWVPHLQNVVLGNAGKAYIVCHKIWSICSWCLAPKIQECWKLTCEEQSCVTRKYPAKTSVMYLEKHHWTIYLAVLTTAPIIFTYFVPDTKKKFTLPITLHIYCAYSHLEERLHHRLLGTTPKISDSLGLWWDWKMQFFITSYMVLVLLVQRFHLKKHRSTSL